MRNIKENIGQEGKEELGVKNVPTPPRVSNPRRVKQTQL